MAQRQASDDDSQASNDRLVQLQELRQRLLISKRGTQQG